MTEEERELLLLISAVLHGRATVDLHKLKARGVDPSYETKSALDRVSELSQRIEARIFLDAADVGIES